MNEVIKQVFENQIKNSQQKLRNQVTTIQTNCSLSLQEHNKQFIVSILQIQDTKEGFNLYKQERKMKQLGKKMTRGQMVYAPITANERTTRSPFTKTAAMGSASSLSKQQNQQYNMYSESEQTPFRQSANSNIIRQSSIKKQSSSLLIKNNSNGLQNNSSRQIQETFMSSPPRMARISSPPKIGRISSQPNQVYLENQSSPSRNNNKQSLAANFNVSNSPTTNNNNQTTSTKNNPYQNPKMPFQSLIKQNELLKSHESIYITKLIKLQQGLHRQHQQFMNLQDLYTDLFHVYKLKEEEFAELQKKYKELEASNHQFEAVGGYNNVVVNAEKYGSFGQGTGEFNGLQSGKDTQKDLNFNNSPQQQLQNNSLMSSNSINYSLYQQAFKQQLSQLIYQNKRLNQTNQKLITELNYLKSKHNLHSSKQFLQTKFMTEMSETQKQLQLEKEQKLQLEYQNKYLQLRTQDLEKTVTELESVITIKQMEIMKIREEKIHMRKQSSQNLLNKSPPKQDSARSKKHDSARSKSSNTEKKYNKLLDNLQKQNQKLRQQNFQLKQKLKSTITSNLTSSRLSSDPYTNAPYSLNRRLNFNQTLDMKSSLSNQNLMSLRSYQNQNFNSQNINEQYFSFSKQREDKLSQEELPSFPMDLEIEKIIKKHQQKCSNTINDQNYESNQDQLNKQTGLTTQRSHPLEDQCSV